MRKLLLPMAMFVCACTHTKVDVGAGSPQGGVQAHVEGGRGLAAVLGLSLLAVAIHDYETARAGSGMDPRTVPELDPGRKVSEQDCTRPLDYSLGNIRCK